MEELRKETMNAPEGVVDEKELQELADVETPDGGVTPTVTAATIAVSVAVSNNFCPSTKCTSKC